MASDNQGFNFNVLGNAGSGGSGKQILIGRVTKIILGQFTKDGRIDKDFILNGGWGSIGCIKFNLFQDSNNPEGEGVSNVFAKPLFSNFKQYPLVGEIVGIIAGPSPNLNENASAKDYFYLPAYNLWNSQHHNGFPDLRLYEKQISGQSVSNPDVSRGAVNSSISQSLTMPLGDYFTERSDINPTIPFEGDVIVEGRFGQSIRLGSTVSQQSNNNTWSTAGQTGDPITIISNKKSAVSESGGWLPTVEDINKDGAQLWLSHNQAISLNVANYPLDTFRLGYQATYNPDTVLPLIDFKPAIQNLAASFYDKQTLEAT